MLLREALDILAGPDRIPEKYLNKESRSIVRTSLSTGEKTMTKKIEKVAKRIMARYDSPVNWTEFGFYASEAAAWSKAGFTPEEASEWRAEDFKVDEAAAYKNDGYTLARAKKECEGTMRHHYLLDSTREKKSANIKTAEGIQHSHVIDHLEDLASQIADAFKQTIFQISQDRDPLEHMRDETFQ